MGRATDGPPHVKRTTRFGASMGHRQHPTMNISHVVYVCNRSLYLVIALVSYGKWAAGGKRRGARSPRQRAERRHTDADGSGWYLRGACARARDVEAWARPSRAAYPYARRCFVLRRFGSEVGSERSGREGMSCLPVCGKRHRGEPGRTRDTGHIHGIPHTGAPGSHRRTSQPSKPNHTRTHPHDHATAETAADSTAAGPEPTAPRR